jgi:hypothetical protein
MDSKGESNSEGNADEIPSVNPIESLHCHHVRLVDPPEYEKYHHEESDNMQQDEQGHKNTSDQKSTLMATLCSNCRQQGIQYESYPCRCLQFCKKCAMKMATGGKCKSCHQLYSTMVLTSS